MSAWPFVAAALIVAAFMLWMAYSIETGRPFPRVRLGKRGPRYCTRCGAMMLPRRGRTRYEEKSGQPWHYAWLECPKFETDRLGFFASAKHDTDNDRDSWSAYSRTWKVMGAGDDGPAA